MSLPQTRPLFRREVIEFQQHTRQWGRVVPLQPVPARITFWLIISAVAAVAAFLSTTTYSRKQLVVGYLTPLSGSARIFAPREGIIRAVRVTQGQVVQEGEPLFTIAVPQIAADGTDVNASVLASLRQQQQSLAQQIAADQERGESEAHLLVGKIANLQTELARMSTQLLIQRARITLAQQLVAAAQKLAPRGLISNVEQHQRESDVLQQTLNLNNMLQKQTEQQVQLSQAQFELKTLPTVTKGKLQTLRSSLADTEQRIAEVSGRSAYVVRAPISGRVSMLQASAGARADPKNLLAQIVPANAALQAELFIPQQAIGFVKTGQDVRIHYDAFPYQQFGAYHGRIVSVSQTIVTPQDAAGPLALTGTAYRAVARLARPDVDAYGKRVALQPDMVFHAYVILNRQTLVDWLLDPLWSARG